MKPGLDLLSPESRAETTSLLAGWVFLEVLLALEHLDSALGVYLPPSGVNEVFIILKELLELLRLRNMSEESPSSEELLFMFEPNFSSSAFFLVFLAFFLSSFVDSRKLYLFP